MTTPELSPADTLDELISILAAMKRREERAQEPRKPIPSYYQQHHALLGRITQAHRMMELIEIDLLALGAGTPAFMAVKTARIVMMLQQKLLRHCYRVTWQYSDMMRQEEKRMERLYATHALYPKKIGGTYARIDAN